MGADYRIEPPWDEKKLSEWITRLDRLSSEGKLLEKADKETQDLYGLIPGNPPVRNWETPFQKLYLNISAFREDLGKRSNIRKNTKEEMACWIEELLWFIESEAHRVIRTKDLEEVNQRLATRANNVEWELNMVKKEATEAVDNVLDFASKKALLQEQTGGGTPPDGDWLTKMKIGTEFLVRPKSQKTWILAKFMQAGVRHGNVLLIPMKGEDVTCPDSEWIWADPVEFCKFWEFKGILLEPIDE